MVEAPLPAVLAEDAAPVPQPVAPEPAKSESAKQAPWQAAGKPAAPEAARPEATKPEAAKSEAAKPEAAKPEAAKPRAYAKQAPPAKQAAPRPHVAQPAKPGAPERSTGLKLVLQQLSTEIRGSLLEVCSHSLAGLQQQAGAAEGQHGGRLLPRGLQNSGNLCFMNATLQVGSHCGQVAGLIVPVP